MKDGYSKERTAYKWYVLGILTAVYTLSILDQGVIGLLLPAIQQDLRLTDTQLGELTGLGFGIAFSVAGVPAAYWADRANRVAISSGALALWGGSMVASWFAGNFFRLVLARIGCAVGGAACMPATYALIGDHFPQAKERSAALTLYTLANPLALLVGLGISGWLSTHLGWRLTLASLGLPGLLTSLLLALTVREPRLSQAASSPRSGVRARGLISMLWRRPTTRHLTIAITLLYTTGLGLVPWYPAFLIRSHATDPTQIGLWLGVIFGVGGSVGILVGGYVAVRVAAESESHQLRLIALAVALSAPCMGLFLLLPSTFLALCAFVPFTILACIYFGPTFSLLQRLVADDVRATTLALVMLVSNLIGMGLGPQLVGSLSDLFAGAVGIESLRYAMLTVSTLILWSAYHFWRAARSVCADLKSPVAPTRGASRQGLVPFEPS